MAMNTGAELPGPGAGPGGADGTADGLPDDERLACGRLLSEVWETREEGADDPHPRACPHCAAAVRQLDLLGAAVREAGSGREPEWDAGALTERVMDVVRLELRPGPPLPLGEWEEDLWVREAMAAKTLRAAAETVPGVRAGSCRIRPAEAGGVPARGPVRVRLEVVVPIAPGLPDLAEEIRRRVRGAADEALGLPVADVDVHITDVTDPAETDSDTNEEEGERP
ncbi:Asp23/Gls24 family envelope stress response protein [Streptomyces sp. BB1-1-1]|uniref:Asp23/Gls24 family envelope stress response protein n=1 Tax=Streptomyces sp. BB1-1-1 TaxID=3074430 RepID=UPI00287753B8|nr:Asp23/Gls24 family envelope stress response protein [Streptomyces sp. BB1-1-1]WND34188.1 Asp23/Gls24 family envelope stress response protein [Streptomyces sp. BB1-1-1]